MNKFKNFINSELLIFDSEYAYYIYNNKIYIINKLKYYSCKYELIIARLIYNVRIISNDIVLDPNCILKYLYNKEFSIFGNKYLIADNVVLHNNKIITIKDFISKLILDFRFLKILLSFKCL